MSKHSGMEGVKVTSEFINFYSAFLSKALLNLVHFLSKIRELLVILCYITCNGAVFYSLSILLYSFQAENKGENESDEGDKAQDGENEKNSEKEQDSEVSEDAKSGNLRKVFKLYYMKL